jgi:hypothetical protein
MISLRSPSNICIIPNLFLLCRISIKAFSIGLFFFSLHLNCFGLELNNREMQINDILRLTASGQIEKLEQLFANSQPILSHLPIQNRQNISWDALINTLEKDVRFQQLSQKKQFDLKIWINIFRNRQFDLNQLFPNNDLIQHYYPNKTHLVKIDDGFVTKPMGSMWLHCKNQFLFSHPGTNIHLVSGYFFPAFELYKLSQDYSKLSAKRNNDFLTKNSHLRHITSKITIQLKSDDKASSNQTIRSLFKTCRNFGFSAYHHLKGNTYELFFKNILLTYQQILNTSGLSKSKFGDILSVLQKTDFYPSPNGLRVILALGEQESGFSWNPRLPQRKKNYLQRIYNNFENKINNRFWGGIANWFIPNDFNQQKDGFLKQFKSIINPLNNDVTEFDYYLWRKQVLALLEKSKTGQSSFSIFGHWLFDLEKVIRRLKFELQTYGPWQININHFQHYLSKHPTELVLYPEITDTANQQLSINRLSFIRSISGRPEAPLNRKRVLELLVNFYLKPRYQIHMLGDPEDLLFFIAEHLTGKLTTFKTALQKALNDQLGSDLYLDGDLVNYQPYSLSIDWDKTSQTQIQLNNFIGKNQKLFTKPIDNEKLINILCQAETWQELQRSELYLNIMRNQAKKRIFPKTRTNLYQQYPQQYSQKVFNQALKIN